MDYARGVAHQAGKLQLVAATLPTLVGSDWQNCGWLRLIPVGSAGPADKNCGWLRLTQVV
jgi:hypothetical protein